MPPKLIPSLRALFSTGISLAHTRLALAGIELEEEVQRFLHAAAFGLVALIFVLLALIVGTFTIVAAVAPDARVATMVVLTAIYAVVALVAVLRVRWIFVHRPAIFAGTLAELEKDKETFTQMNRAYRAADDAREAGDLSQEDAFAPVRGTGGTAHADRRGA